MPLSEHEQNVLEQMERALYAEDPHLATRLSSGHVRGRHRRIILGGIGALLGLGLVVCGVVGQLVWLGAIGFLVMVLAVIVALTRPRSAQAAATGDAPTGNGSTGQTGTESDGPSRPKDKGQGRAQRPTGFMERLEERWEKREGSGW